jgi:hypothetical protein
MRQSVIIIAMAALVTSGCGGGGASTTPALTPQSGVLQPQSAAHAEAGKHHEADCDDRDGRKRDSRDSSRRADHDDRDERDGGDRERDRDECTPNPTPTPAPTARPPGPLTVTCDTYAVPGTPANCALSNPSFTGPVAMAYSGVSACTGPASVVVPPAGSAQFQVNASGGGGCHVAGSVGSQQAAADITFTR